MTLTHDGPVTDPARFRPQGQDDLAPSGAASRVAANLAALRALRVLQAEGRPATPDEQAVLARWSGWGAVPQVFDDDRDEFAAARAELHQLLPEPRLRGGAADHDQRALHRRRAGAGRLGRRRRAGV